jgi:hypothetical protein
LKAEAAACDAGPGAAAVAGGGPPDDTPVTDMGSATAASAARIFERRRMVQLPDRDGDVSLFTLGRDRPDVNG